MRIATDAQIAETLAAMAQAAREIRDDKEERARCLVLVRLFVAVAGNDSSIRLRLVEKDDWLWAVGWLRDCTLERQFGDQALWPCY